MNRESCPAPGERCNKCNCQNHFAARCSKKNGVNQVTDELSEDIGLIAQLPINQPPSGKGTSQDPGPRPREGFLPGHWCCYQSDISKLDLAPDKLFKMWNGSPQRSLGQATIKLYNPKTRSQYDAVFDIVSEQCIPMLGVHTSQSMGLVTINEDILERVATVKAHCHGAESCIRRARQSLFWLRMAADIRAAVEKCEVCAQKAHRQQRESLQQPDTPKKAWSRVSVDIMESDGHN